MQLVYNINFEIAAIFNYALVLYYSLMRRSSKQFQNLLFIGIGMNGLVSAILDILTAYANTPGVNMSYGLRWSSNFLFLFIHNGQTFLFFLYTMTIIKRLTFHNKRNIFVYEIPYYVVILCLFTNMVGNTVFYFDENMNYQHGPLIYVLYGCSLFYLVMIMVYAMKSSGTLPRKDMQSLFAIAFGAIISVLTQLILGNVLIEIFLESIILIALLISVEDKSRSFDHDTECFDRNLFINNMSIILANELRYTVMFVRLHGLKYYKTFYGDPKKNEIIRRMAMAIKKNLKVEEVYYCGKGAICVFIPQSTEKEIEAYTQQVIEQYHAWEEKDHVSIQFGKVNVPEEISTLSDLMEIIDSDYHNDIDRPMIVPQDEISKQRRKLEVSRAVRRGVDNKNFYAVFQPIFHVPTGEIHSAEVLARLEDPDLGNIPPFEFMTVAEETGHIWELGLIIFEEACKFLKKAMSFGITYFEVNVSVMQCVHGGLSEAFLEILRKYDLRPGNINLEFTESAFIQEPELFMKEKEKLKKAGFSFSVDDYGTGFSNYSYIRMMDPVIIKFDRSSLLTAKKDEAGRKFYHGTIETMRNMGFSVVAEGVETDEELQIVKEAGVNYIQGFYFSRPQKAEDFERVVREIEYTYSRGKKPEKR